MSTETQNTETQAQSAIVANYDKNVDVRDFKFNFKKDELGNKRASVELKLPVPSVEGIIQILTDGGKGLELLQDCVADVIASQARSIVNDKEDISQENFPFAQVLWDAIANLPKAERRGGGISKELWEAFAKDYVEVMPAVTGKSVEAIGNAAKIYLNKFNAVKTNKPVLRLLKDQLALYLVNSPNAETYTDCVEFLDNKAKTLVEMDEASLLANL
jgi:hypothetical protein